MATGLRGTIVDAETGTPLPGVIVEVIGGDAAGATATTDDDGRYALPLPRGTYTLRIRTELYQIRRVRNVRVGGGVTDLDAKLRLDDLAVEEVVVEAEPDRKSEAANLAERKRSATVQDAVSAQEISRTPDSSAGDAVKRVVSATVVGGRYVFVRGLGGRYSTTLLNGVVLPSPDPDSTAVPLDLFPAALVANLTVVKSYTPDLPGAFAGGDLVIQTNTYPEHFELKAKVGFAGDSTSTFKDRLDYRGGGTDFLAFDDGTRALPGDVPTDRPLRVGQGGVDAPTAERVGESFQDVWNTRAQSIAPNLSLAAQVGDTLKDACGRTYGYLGTVNYGYKQAIQRGKVASVRLAEGQLGVRERLDSDVGTATASLGGLLNAGVAFGPNHKLDLLTLYTRTADDRTQEVQGFSESDNQDILGRRFAFVTRAMSFTQLTGRHTLTDYRRLRLEWEGNLAFIQRDEPDTRDIQFDLLEDGRRRFQTGPGSGEHFFSRLDDTTGGLGASAALPLADVELKVGGTGQWSQRDFAARRFRFNLVGGDPDVVFLDPEEMLSADHVGREFRVEERTLQADVYAADSSLVGGFVMADVSRFEPLRLVGGVRYERSALALTPGSPYAITSQPEPGIDRADAHWMPAANAIYALADDMNLRGGYSFTVARPQLRELAPFLFFDFVRRRAVSGNVDLRDTRIHNADLRWEWFPAERSVLAVSAFAKRFRDPIESVIVNTSQGDVSFANADGASLQGVELEARGDLGFLDHALAAFRGSANLTLIDSQIELGPEAAAQTNQARPLQGQSSYVVNLDLGWDGKASGTDVSLLYNVFGPRIAEVGIEGLPDVYEQPYHRVDLTASQRLPRDLKLKVAAQNLLNQAVVVKQGDITVQEYQPGVAVSASLEWSP
ncbi:MAG: TonB-dependent receptor [Myxococcales bacterium]|nr:TonB-dependent receptor [Myxococcales bacterium]